MIEYYAVQGQTVSMFDSMIPASTTSTTSSLASPAIPNALNSLGFNTGTFTVPQVPLPIEQQANACSSSSLGAAGGAAASNFVEKKVKPGKKSKVTAVQQHQIYATPITDPNGNIHHFFKSFMSYYQGNLFFFFLP